MALEMNAPTSRRNALKIGGLSVSMAALAAACGEDRAGDDAPGRVGNAPSVTAPIEYDVDDVVRLRTAASLELTAVSVYEQALELQDAIPSAAIPLVQRLIADHAATAEIMNGLVEAADGVAWTCENPWLMDRLVGPVFEAIQSNAVGVMVEVEGEPELQLQVMGTVGSMTDSVMITPELGEVTAMDDMPDLSDLEAGDEIEFSRLQGSVSADVLAFAIALENLAAASHQELASATSILDARVAHIEASTLESRHASVLAFLSVEDPSEAYISPVLVGGEDVPDIRSQIRAYAIPAQFGQTAQIEVKGGPGDLNNVREGFTLQTPAANSLIYNELSCDS